MFAALVSSPGKHREDKATVNPNDARTMGERSGFFSYGTAENRLNDSQRGTLPDDGGNDTRSERTDLPRCFSR